MQTVKCGLLNKNTVLLYDDPDNMPVSLYSLWNKYQLIDSAIGSTVNDITDKHLKTLYAIAGDRDKTVEELNNLRQLFNLLFNNTDPSHLAFACLVHSINGHEFEDRSETGLQDIVLRLSKAGFTQSELKKKVQKSKSSFFSKLMHSFPLFIQKRRLIRNSTITT